jgi:hypothetical protein
LRALKEEDREMLMHSTTLAATGQEARALRAKMVEFQAKQNNQIA